MAYSEQTWANGRDGGTKLNAARLQHMEDGIAAAVPGAIYDSTGAPITTKTLHVTLDPFGDIDDLSVI